MTLLVDMQHIHKSFPGIKVLNDVHFQLQAGEVHALMGENGAGKSTLMKILSGIYHKDQGQIRIKGQEVDIDSPGKAQELGIAIIHQELNLVPNLTIMENMFLGREMTWGKTGWLRRKEMYSQTKAYLERLGLDLDPDTPTGSLSVGQQQMVEIAKVLSMDADILVMDEPTAALTQREIERLFDLIRQLKAEGAGIIYISHRMEEIFEISDRITVLRDGHYVGTEKTRAVTLENLIKMMVGRQIGERFPYQPPSPGEEVLRVEHLTRQGILDDISFSVHAGEVVGIAGLMGAGRTELVRALFGADPITSGEIYLQGQKIDIRSPRDAIRHGIALVTEDRKDQGLILGLSVRENLSLPSLSSLSRYTVINSRKENKQVKHMIERLQIKTSSPEQNARSLSGGNQQKVVIGKWLAITPKVLILDEPTRGVDIGAKKEIYHIMNQLKAQGVAIIMVSSELPEILGMSDRILVMHEGKLTAELTREEANQEKIMYAATGGV